MNKRYFLVQRVSNFSDTVASTSNRTDNPWWMNEETAFACMTNDLIFFLKKESNTHLFILLNPPYLDPPVLNPEALMTPGQSGLFGSWRGSCCSSDFSFCPCQGRFVRWGDTKIHSSLSGLNRRCGCSFSSNVDIITLLSLSSWLVSTTFWVGVVLELRFTNKWYNEFLTMSSLVSILRCVNAVLER